MKLREEINKLENLDYDRRFKNLMRWMKKHNVSKAGDTLIYRKVECMLTVVDGRFPVAYVMLQPLRSNQKINKNYGAPKTISFD